MDREHRRTGGPQYIDYRFISIHVIMNQGCIEDRDITVLRSDGANIYAGFVVSNPS